MILPKSNRLTPAQLAEVTGIVAEFGCTIQPIIGALRTIYAIVGDERDDLMINRLEGLDYVERIDRIQSPFKLMDKRSDLASHRIRLGGVTLGEELLHVPHLGVEVALADLRTELHFLDRHLDGLLARLLGLLALLVAELAVVHDPAHGRRCQRGDFDEVEVELTGQCEGLRERLDPELIAVRADEANLTGADAIVVPVLGLLRRCYGRSLLCNGLVLPVV